MLLKNKITQCNIYMPQVQKIETQYVLIITETENLLI